MASREPARRLSVVSAKKACSCITVSSLPLSRAAGERSPMVGSGFGGLTKGETYCVVGSWMGGAPRQSNKTANSGSRSLANRTATGAVRTILPLS